MAPTKDTPRKAASTAASRQRKSSDSEDAITPSKRARVESPAQRVYTHVPPRPSERAANGRRPGRNLITWTRPRMIEKVLLHLVYECARVQVDIPWELIAHRLHPGSSGGAILQHLNRMRPQLVAEGHLVPPIAMKPGSSLKVDQKIRGYVRRYESPAEENTTATRPVYFTEHFEDRRFNLPDAYDAPGTPHVGRDQLGAQNRRSPNKVKKEREPSPEPTEEDSEDEYVQVPTNRERRSRAAKVKQIDYNEAEAEEEEELEESELIEEEDASSPQADQDQEQADHDGSVDTTQTHDGSFVTDFNGHNLLTHNNINPGFQAALASSQGSFYPTTTHESSFSTQPHFAHEMVYDAHYQEHNGAGHEQGFVLQEGQRYDHEQEQEGEVYYGVQGAGY